MARLIDVDKALEKLRKVEPKLKVVSIVGIKAVSIDGFIDFLERQKTVDAVEVVHCKDCKHCYKSYGSSTGYRCKVWGVYDNDCEVTPEHYCSYGERKDND